jgi:membrane protease YdiL (CAAX protease family)
VLTSGSSPQHSPLDRPGLLNPKRILYALDEIDQSADSYRLSRPQALRRVFMTLALVSVSLLLLHYGKFSSNLRLLLSEETLQHWQDAGWLPLAGYAWWTLVHVLTFLLLPWLVIRFGFRERMADFGWRWADTSAHWRGYLLLLSPILVFVVLVSFGEDFVNHYPFYPHASRSWADFLAWECLYLTQFVVLEFFFRGFMLQALRPAVGANAVWIMCVPYLMIHFPKLWLEATGAILFGLFLGILALRSRSIWGGVMVHAGVALSMDVAALLRQSGLPQLWWPF